MSRDVHSCLFRRDEIWFVANGHKQNSKNKGEYVIR
jgi:hypothetical protein